MRRVSPVEAGTSSSDARIIKATKITTLILIAVAVITRGKYGGLTLIAIIGAVYIAYIESDKEGEESWPGKVFFLSLCSQLGVSIRALTSGSGRSAGRRPSKKRPRSSTRTAPTSTKASTRSQSSKKSSLESTATLSTSTGTCGRRKTPVTRKVTARSNGVPGNSSL